MKCARDYRMIIADNGQLAFVITAQEGEQSSPYLLYNGKDAALLYRSGTDILVLDKLHERAQEALRENSLPIIIVEADYGTGTTVRDYQVNQKK